MSRVEGNDDQRIREMQEAQLRQRVDAEKRTQAEKVSKSFNDVMTQRNKTEEQQKGKLQKGAQSAQKETKRTEKAKSEAAPKMARDLGARAVETRRALEDMNRTRHVASDESRAQETSRREEAVTRADDENELVDRSVKGDDMREFQRMEARHEDFRVDPDDHRDQGRQQNREQRRDDGDDRAPKAEGVAATQGPRAAQAVKIPQELLQQLASAMHVALDKSGGTEVLISLKGSMLEGVTLKVSSKKGKVRAIFEGCDKQTKNLIESSKGDLMRQLSKRGLELDILRAT